MKTNSAAPLFCLFKEFEHLLLMPTNVKEVVRQSRRGAFPKFWKSGGQRSPSLWRRDHVLTWLRKLYSDVMPERLDALNASDFAKSMASNDGVSDDAANRPMKCGTDAKKKGRGHV
jgi:hypothetical protein